MRFNFFPLSFHVFQHYIRIMDKLLAIVLLSGCLQIISGEVVKNHSKRDSADNARIEITMTKIQEGKLNEAVTAFADATDGDIDRIVTLAYEKGVEFGTIYEFIVRLPVVTRIVGIRAIHNQIKTDNRMDHRIWILANGINQILDPRPELHGDVVDAVMTDVKAIVRDDNFDGLARFLNEHATDGLESIKLFAPLFVKTIYEEGTNNVSKVFNVLNKFTFVQHRLYLVNEFIVMLQTTNRMFGKDITKIVFELTKLRTEKTDQSKDWWKVIEQNLPEAMRDLLYNNLCIRNALTGEYLYAGHPSALKNQRHIYAGKMLTVNETFYWQVYFTDNGSKTLIKNSFYNENIYLLDEGHPEIVPVLRSWMPQPMDGDYKAEFYLNMLPDGQFIIGSIHFGQVLYSPYNEEANIANMRPIFSKPYDPQDDDTKWIIGVCRHERP